MCPRTFGHPFFFRPTNVSLSLTDIIMMLNRRALNCILILPFFLSGIPQNQRKKAVDSTFIRFGRSSPSESNLGAEDVPKVLQRVQQDADDSSKSLSQQQFILDHKGCRISNSKELVRALMNDRNCIRAFQKVKRENVNDTFIRFGKRSVPSEEEDNGSQNNVEEA